MSGLVIARSYEGKLLSGVMSLKDFFWVRLLRLYPLYISGLFLGLGYLIFRWVIKHEDPIDFLEIGRGLSLNALFIPDFQNKENIFMLDPAAWSLSLEWIVNLIYAAFVVKFSTRAIVYIAVGGLLLLLGTGIYAGHLDLGWSAENFIGGFVRILFSFTVGILIYRLMDFKKISLKLPALFIILSVLAVLIFPLEQKTIYYDLICVFLAFPALVYFACTSEIGLFLKRPFYVLGQISYALYILHTPLILWLAGGWKMIAHSEPQDNPIPSFVFIVTGVLVISFLATKIFDEPVRRYLRKYI